MKISERIIHHLHDKQNNNFHHLIIIVLSCEMFKQGENIFRDI